jgi:hypothetical protein
VEENNIFASPIRSGCVGKTGIWASGRRLNEAFQT